MREAEVSSHRIGPSRLLIQVKVRHDTLLGGQIFRTALKDIKVRAMILRVLRTDRWRSGRLTMGLFGKKASAATGSSSVALPPDLVSRLEPFGRFEFDPQESGVDPIGFPNADYPLMQMARQDPDGFMAALAAATVPIGGWTAYGAMRLVWHFGLSDPDIPQADSDAISMAALQFLHDSGYPRERLNPREMAFWRRIAGREWS